MSTFKESCVYVPNPILVKMMVLLFATQGTRFRAEPIPDSDSPWSKVPLTTWIHTFFWKCEIRNTQLRIANTAGSVMQTIGLPRIFVCCTYCTRAERHAKGSLTVAWWKSSCFCIVLQNEQREDPSGLEKRTHSPTSKVSRRLEEEENQK